MTPLNIVLAAMDAHLDLIAICDHNSTGNAAAVQYAAHAIGEGRLTVFAGIEITTAEEAHLLGVFPCVESAETVGQTVRDTLPTLSAAANIYGEQYLVAPDGAILGKEPKTLSMASAFPLSDAVKLIHAHGGAAIAAHVDRPSFSVTSQLGFIPENASFDALEISAEGSRTGRQQNFAALGLPMITSSDAHFLSAIGECRTLFEMNSCSFLDWRNALRANPSERRCRIA